MSKLVVNIRVGPLMFLLSFFILQTYLGLQIFMFSSFFDPILKCQNQILDVFSLARFSHQHGLGEKKKLSGVVIVRWCAFNSPNTGWLLDRMDDQLLRLSTREDGSCSGARPPTDDSCTLPKQTRFHSKLKGTSTGRAGGSFWRTRARVPQLDRVWKSLNKKILVNLKKAKLVKPHQRPVVVLSHTHCVHIYIYICMVSSRPVGVADPSIGWWWW
jgi:hypothetical protein